MFDNIIRYFFSRKKCTHDLITPSNLERFCPDCGREVVLYWQIVRCSECQTKRKGFLKFDNAVPSEKYCSRCGSEHYYVETRYKVDYFDFNYAIVVKEESADSRISASSMQIWVDNNDNLRNMQRPKLLTTHAH